MAPLGSGFRFSIARDHSSGNPLDPEEPLEPEEPDDPLEPEAPLVPDEPLAPLDPDDEPAGGQLPDDWVAVQFFFASSSVYG